MKYTLSIILALLLFPTKINAQLLTSNHDSFKNTTEFSSDINLISVDDKEFAWNFLGVVKKKDSNFIRKFSLGFGTKELSIIEIYIKIGEFEPYKATEISKSPNSYFIDLSSFELNSIKSKEKLILKFYSTNKDYVYEFDTKSLNKLIMMYEEASNITF